MAEETEELTTEEIEDQQDIQETDESTETKEVEQEGEHLPEKPEAESGGSFIKKVKDKYFSKKAAEVVEEGDDIPDEFVQAARRMNWSDEETIAYADQYTDAELLEKIPSILGEAAVKTDDTSDKVDVIPETKDVKVEDSQDDEGPNQALINRLAEIEKKLQIDEEVRKKEELARFDQRASELFDRTSDEFEIFGKTDNLPKFPDGRIDPTSPQMKARLEVWGRADQLRAGGMDSDEALSLSLNAYIGSNLKTEAKRSVIKGLKKQEKILRGKSSSHEVADLSNLSGADVIAEVKRRHGK